VYYILPKRVRNLWLLIASCFFYGCYNATYTLLLAGVTLTTWGCGLMIQRGVNRLGEDEMPARSGLQLRL